MEASRQSAESALCDRLRLSLKIAREVQQANPSRHNSLVITHLEDALTRAIADTTEKVEAGTGLT
jgi:hypothetical protein